MLDIKTSTNFDGLGPIVQVHSPSWRATNVELTAWLHTGFGRIKGFGCDYTYVVYRVERANANNPIDDDVRVKALCDGEWHIPTIEYMSKGLDAYRHMFPTGLLSDESC